MAICIAIAVTLKSLIQGTGTDIQKPSVGQGSFSDNDFSQEWF